MNDLTLDCLLNEAFKSNNNFPYLEFEEDDWVLALDYLPPESGYYSVICAHIDGGVFSTHSIFYYYAKLCYYNLNKRKFALINNHYAIVLYWKKNT